MIKLFEKHENLSFKECIELSHPLLYDFLWKIKYFFDDIVLSGHKVTLDIGTNVYLEIYEVNQYVVSVRLQVKDFLPIFIRSLQDQSKYPLLLEYIEMEISQFFDNVTVIHGDINLQFFFLHLSKKYINKINFSKENYEEFKDSNRFGL